MTEERKTVVTLHKKVDGNRFMEEMNSKVGGQYIPERSVEVYNEKPQSISNYDFVMTRAEAAALKSDPRVRDVRWGTKKELGIKLCNEALSDPWQYNRFDAGDNTTTDRNWGLYACNEGGRTDDGPGSENYRHKYTLTGKGVDVVIMDDGIEYFHPEFNDGEGNSRVQLIDWPELAGLEGSIEQSPFYYTANTEGHGTLCASIVAGNTYGWANEALIYSLAMVSSVGNPKPWMFGVSDSFNLLRAWHLNKGNGRPTVANMSWSYFIEWDFDVFRYRGTFYTNRNGEYDNINPAPEFAMRDTRHPLRVTSVDSDIEDCIDAGVILCAAASNQYNYIDVPGGLDYENFYEKDDQFGTWYWCQGGTPARAEGVIVVGNVDSSRRFDGSQYMQFASGRGPGVDIWAPGTNIGGAISQINAFEDIVPSRAYPPDDNFRMTKLTGTSFATPQVTGILAQKLELQPDLAYYEARRWLQANADKDTLYDTTDGPPEDNYDKDQALNGSKNLFLRNPYNRSSVFRYRGDLDLTK